MDNNNNKNDNQNNKNDNQINGVLKKVCVFLVVFGLGFACSIFISKKDLCNNDQIDITQNTTAITLNEGTLTVNIPCEWVYKATNVEKKLTISEIISVQKKDFEYTIALLGIYTDGMGNDEQVKLVLKCITYKAGDESIVSLSNYMDVLCENADVCKELDSNKTVILSYFEEKLF